MNFSVIILASIMGFVTSVPVNSPGYKERIFNIATSRADKIAEFREFLEISDTSTRNSMLEDLLLNVIDMLRDLIVNGSDDVPVLDPFKLDEIHLNEDLIELPNSHVTLKNIVVTNLSTFEIDQLTVSTVSVILQRYRIELDGRIPLLDAQVGNYDLSVNIFGGNIFGNGNLKLKIVNPRIYANIVVGLRLSINGIFLTVRECSLRVNLDAFEPKITGLFDNETASEFVSSFLSSLVPEFLEFFEEDITNTISGAVLEIANELLADLNLINLLP